MKACLIFPDRNYDPELPLCPEAETLEKDLGISYILEQMAGEDEQIYSVCRRLIFQPQTDPEIPALDPPEIAALTGFFTRTAPPCLDEEGLDAVENKSGVTWLKVQGGDAERSVNEYLAFKPRAGYYRTLRLTLKADVFLGAFREGTTYFVVDSPDALPKDPAAYERLKAAAAANAIEIVEEVSRGVYHEFFSDRFYRVEVDEIRPGVADDAAIYGAYHLHEITRDEALKRP